MKGTIIRGRMPTGNLEPTGLNESYLNTSGFLNDSNAQLVRTSADPNTQIKKTISLEQEDDVYKAETKVSQPLIRKSKIDNESRILKRIQVNFGPGSMQNPAYNFKSNYIRTTKYTLLSWLPLSLLQQFLRFANIYFLIITILTNLDFSPKQPVSQIVTFVIVLVFTMLKEGFEDLQRYKQDREVNNAQVLVYSETTKKFEIIKSAQVKVGNLVQVQRDQTFPADILLLKTSSESGIAFVNTMNLDGETNLKEKICLKQTKIWTQEEVFNKKGTIECEGPNEFLEAWEGNLQVDGQQYYSDIKQLCLRGTTLKNTGHIYGIVVYTGSNTKIMKNAKHARSKMSSVLKKMNKILISVFVLQAFLILTFSTISMKWQDQNGTNHIYLATENDIDFGAFFLRYFTFLVAYSHLIPISLYVALEIFKLMQSYFMRWDDEMYYSPLNKHCIVRTSDLVEELGQVEIIFSDKTGTLTMNEMEFKKCSVNLQVFGNDGDPSKSKDKFTINGEVTAFEYLNDPEESKNKQSLSDFFTLLSVCHTVIPDHDSNLNQIKYQASSPDELALVEGAAKMGFEFLNRTSSTIQIQLFTGEIQEWEIYAEFPFDSTRKRMSLLVKRRDCQEFLLLSKGADSIMLPRLIQDQNILPIIQRHLEGFAVEGLRTLLVAQKRIDPMTAHTILKNYELLKLSNDPQKENKLDNFYSSIEQDLSFVGCTAIEDKLQEGVPETIATLLVAGIKIWVLTGDKQETAIEIAKSCKMIQAGMDTVILSAKSPNEFLTILDKNIAHYRVDLYGPIMTIEEGSQKLVHRLTIVIDGSTLVYALESQIETRNKFFRLALLASSVICCRVSPKQKADVVNLTKSYGSWITLAIGDGANDVSMIREAHVGIGIYGKEGTQAARTADFALGQFRYLKKLLLVHGRLGYKRISTFILYYFYKNVILVFTEIYFAFYNGFSGQVYFIDWLPMLYNSLWTSWPPLFAYFLEKDVSKELSYKFPKLYKAGPRNYYFNMETFWTWMAYAAWHGIVSFYLPVFGLSGVNDDSGQVRNHWWVSTISFSLIMHIITYKLFLQTTFWNSFGVVFILLGLILYYISIFFMSLDPIARFIQPQLNGVFVAICQSVRAILVLIFVPFVVIGPDIIIQVIKRIIKPNPADKVLRLHRNGPDLKKKSLTSGLNQNIN